MTKCPHCRKEIPDDRSSCPSCGTALGDSFTPTRLLPDEGSGAAGQQDATRRKAAANSSRSSTSFDSIDDARFTPGTTLAGRYRIVSLLGRGGMGEVYRADDLKLGQPVALKFLPETLSTDGAALARFHREVRVARQVSHRNVCRVYDIGEIDGQHFLSMEFIKGEELASLLRRIGRLPADKAVEIARQLCAGISAAHDNNVLHRDLKPANVMIDADGNVRVTDFGLAGLAEEIHKDEVRAGTPAYMAPEQLSGEGVSVKSDIYSLGLVLYEVFTGKRAFEAGTLDELLRLRKSETTPTTPSSLVKEIDPLVERVILRCLEKNPKDRPASALQVAAALPGGDPLQAALAAGETPSPEMVAAAPKEGALRPMVATALLASFLVLYALACVFSDSVSLYSLASLDKSPEILQERARDIIKRLGYTDVPADSAYGMTPNETYLQYVIENDQSRNRWDALKTGQPAGFNFWYRQSPRYMKTSGAEQIRADDPPEIFSGMARVSLDTEGRLRLFSAVPAQREEPENRSPASAPDWSTLFAEAGFNQANFQPVESVWVPQHAYDARAAWDGVYPAQPFIKIHLEAAAYRGKPIYFEVINPWDVPGRQVQRRESASDRVLYLLLIMIGIVAMVGSALLALKNLRLGRGDRRGAFRLALFVFTLTMLIYLFDAHHTWTNSEFDLFFSYIQSALLAAFFLWLLYIALEPYVRRRWPEVIIGWTRLLAGEFRDPLVGRDILIGSVLGAALITNNYLVDLVPKWLGLPPNKPFIDAHLMLGMRRFMPEFAGLFMSSFVIAFVLLFMLLLFFIILRRKWLAAAATWLVLASLLVLAHSETPLVSRLFGLTGALIFVGGLYRYGLLALIVGGFIFHSWVFFPITTKLSAWWAADFIPVLIIYVALVVYAFYTSLAGQPLFRGKLLED
ncbi:MAG: eukaryotic-like serine/threonine-protein kinase [Acidobacteriota bacterium]|jgi:serine/threonine-protein kinase|nr:eukaryotic-like serine/threonine-protein kinase [Acidobacteriota bacterium]